MVDGLTDGDVCLLENLRFKTAETIKDKKAAADPLEDLHATAHWRRRATVAMAAQALNEIAVERRG